MIILNEAETRNALPFPALIEALRAMFAGHCVMPVRHHHEVEVPGEADATLLLMPAWVPGQFIGVKLVTVFPDNHTRALPAIFGSYILSSGKTGELLAVVDGAELTARRTAAASALAASYQAHPEASSLTMIGAGRLSLNLIEAHSAVRPIQKVTIWARRSEAAEETAARARALGFDALATTDLETAVRSGDIVSAATLSSEPLIRGAWLRPGQHVDLIGAFKPSMRESDDLAVSRAEVHVDTLAGAKAEGGDIVQALASGAIAPSHIRGELADLVAGRSKGRSSGEAITLFKSVGAALEDLAGAILAYQSAAKG